MPIAIHDGSVLVALTNRDIRMTRCVSVLAELSVGCHLTNVPEEKCSLALSENLKVALPETKRKQMALLVVPENRDKFSLEWQSKFVFTATWETCCAN